ncbi:MAG: replication factor A, partial [Haloferacaceae archaeon]
EELDPGQTVEVVDGYVRERDGDLELHVGGRGAIEEVDADVEYVPDTADIGSLEIGQRVDIAGGVIETDPKRTFDRDDGSQGQVRNVRVRDDTGDIRVALWGDKADADVDLADRVVLTDVEIQDGWQDDLEASANWRSTVTVLETDAEAGDDGASDDRPAGGGLAAFADDGGSTAADDGGGGDAAATGSEAGSATSDAGSDPADGEQVEFTGTVVQAGNPVVLDNGRKTRSVATDAELRLGEEVTVRGPLRDGRIDAEEVF